VYWYKDDESLPGHVIVKDNFMLIDNVTLSDCGNYECAGTHSVTHENFQAFSCLSVISKPGHCEVY